MNKTIKKLWLKALRSGKYKQGKEALRTENNEFCCLGVLCDIHAKKFKNKWNHEAYMDKFSYLPPKVMEWANLEQEQVKIKYGTLARANDSGKSFKQIANIIEKQL